MAVSRLGPGGQPRVALSSAPIPFVSLTGTVSGATETEIVDGGLTIILTTTNDTWAASGATFNAERQNIIDGITSVQSETFGWNAEVRDKEVVGAVVRTSDTVVTITLSASEDYDISSAETITVTVPATALAGGSELTAIPSFQIIPVATTGIPLGTFGDYAPTNTDAIEIASNYEICDRSGFKVKAGSLKKEWNGLMVKPEYLEARHPQDFVRVPPEREKGSPRPEQEDQFIDDDVYPNGVSSDDL